MGEVASVNATAPGPLMTVHSLVSRGSPSAPSSCTSPCSVSDAGMRTLYAPWSPPALTNGARLRHRSWFRLLNAKSTPGAGRRVEVVVGLLGDLAHQRAVDGRSRWRSPRPRARRVQARDRDWPDRCRCRRRRCRRGPSCASGRWRGHSSSSSAAFSALRDVRSGPGRTPWTQKRPPSTAASSGASPLVALVESCANDVAKMTLP